MPIPIPTTDLSVDDIKLSDLELWLRPDREWTIAAIDAAANDLFAKTGKSVPVFMPPLEA